MTWLLGLFNVARWQAYALGAFAIVSTIVFSIMKIRADGARIERISQLERTIKHKQVAAQVSADLAALTNAARRQRLRDRWSRN